ncbi:MAG TPA: Holliday junction resolvase RuvX [Blastocatellia bacterium]|nr:Holliday junction resolvase RuvX [Blastocatellia bacterium]
MAIDYGAKAIGVAISDELRLTVRPLTTIRRRRQSRNQIIAQIKALLEEQEATELIVGLPLKLDGTIGEAAERMNVFIAELQKAISVPVIAQDERLTSHEADEMMRELGFDFRQRKARSDEYAAAIILREYLESHR